MESIWGDKKVEKGVAQQANVFFLMPRWWVNNTVYLKWVSFENICIYIQECLLLI